MQMFSKKIKIKNQIDLPEATTLQALKMFYNNKKFILLINIFIVVIGILLGALMIKYLFDLTLGSQLWFVTISVIMVVFTFLKPGLYYILERKKEIIDGFFTFIDDYIVIADDVTFNSFVDSAVETKERKERYPKIFVEEFLTPLSIKIKTEYSTKALSEIMSYPRNNYYELNSFKDFVKTSIESDDKSLRQALKNAIDIAQEGKKRYYDKMKTTKFVSYISIVFMTIFPAIFSGIMMSSFKGGTALPGITMAQIFPAPMLVLMWFTTATIGGGLLIAAYNYFTGEEGKAVSSSYLTMFVIFIAVIIVYIVLSSL